jgi:hypothetical protein
VSSAAARAHREFTTTPWRIFPARTSASDRNCLLLPWAYDPESTSKR